MGYREDDKYIIYPVYFDTEISRKNGRRISRDLSIEKPVISDILRVAKNLGFNPVLENEIPHPSRHWKHDGRILIDKKQSKQSMIIQIANSL